MPVPDYLIDEANEAAAVKAERDQYRQAALELQAEIRHALAWAATGAERSVADAMLLKTAEKWRTLLDDEPSLRQP